MKRISLRLAAAVALTLAFGSAAAPANAATTYVVDPAHSDVSFQIRHMMAKVRGGFNEFSGTIVRDDANLANASVDFRIVATSIDTRHESRDKHLRSEDFFDVAKYPEITFKSTRVERASDNLYRVTGQFSLHGVAKELVLPVTFEGEAQDPRGVLRAGFSLATKISRKEFGMEWNRALNTGDLLLSDEVLVEVSIEAKQEEPAPAPAQ